MNLFDASKYTLYGEPQYLYLCEDTSLLHSPYTTQSDKTFWPLHQQLHRRQHYGPSQQVALNKESVTIGMFLKSLRSRTLSIQGEVIKSLSMMLEEAGRVSNMDDFADSIHKEMLPW